MIGVRRPSVCLMSRTSALTRKPKGLGRRNFAQGYPRSRATRTPTSRSKGQKSRSRGGAYCGGHLAAQLVFVRFPLCRFLLFAYLRLRNNLTYFLLTDLRSHCRLSVSNGCHLLYCSLWDFFRISYINRIVF